MMTKLQSFFGPYLILIKLLLTGLVILSLSRIGLVVWQWDRVVAATSLPTIFWQGIRADLIMMGMLLVPLALGLPLLANQLGWKIWQKLVLIWGVLVIVLISFMEASTPAFISQYDLRPNRLFVEYLRYPKEVFATLWQGFRWPLLIGVTLTIISGSVAVKLLQCWLNNNQKPWPVWKIWLAWPLLLLILALMIRSSIGHRPANPSSFALTPDAMVNSLMLNSAWSVYFAIYNMQHESNAAEVYGTMTDEAILSELHKNYPWIDEDTQRKFPTLNTRQASVQRDKPLNLVIILQESMGATFVESLGGEYSVTPELERLKKKGWWFEQLYATGTRSVRGIEAVISGYLPTPARSVVKLSLSQQNFFTIADLLKQQGYFTEFIYGGESHFDNMASFFIGNGFESVIDQHDYDNPVFTGSWGVSDEDLLNKAHQQLQQKHAEGQPYFSLVFTSSNHSPYEFPDGRIELDNPVKHSNTNTVKYADYALGQFFDKAMQSDYWKDTLFLVIADHDLNVFGDALVPIERFQIPGLILGADIQPRSIPTVASQIDMPPTLLSLMGISAETPMIGRDLSLEREQQSSGRALMQFADYYALMQGEKVTVLRPQNTALEGYYSPSTRQLKIIGPAAAEDERKALAHVLLPSWLYREQRYDMPNLIQ
ncbi:MULTISPECIES: LTA synthase family protein [unclassified Methylophaga]|jgi:phosphoglycerol transferase MdoB-like AlkP superfamily enzyme|uniref:LTA synthase family protein n=1 Tax=unclassified Methylophaga TaxID=2629249 RepID=UPI0025FD7630|nr:MULTISPECIES: LTA synthase family protein [unclassified Methylophaga]|tara:strand:+ start:10321 stop:12285 length:1965 start_codon:yes stop_codon:yes gene_type:complete